MSAPFGNESPALVDPGEQLECLQRELKLAIEHRDRAVRRWSKLEQNRDELGPWLVDQATNSTGELTPLVVDAGLVGDEFVPGTHLFRYGERTYRLSLVSTDYEVIEVLESG